MQKNSRLQLLSLGLTLLLSLNLTAEENEASSGKTEIRYVTDNLVILLRAGPSSRHKILRSMESGTKVEVLGDDGDYSQVKLGKLEGWALSRHLSKHPIAKHRLDSVVKKLEKLEKKNKELKAELQQTKKENMELKGNIEGWTEEKAQLSEELEKIKDVAANPLELSSTNKTLAMQTVSLENKVEMMKQEIQVLRNDSDKRWFMTGAGVVLLGMVIGLLVPKFRRHRRSDWSSIS